MIDFSVVIPAYNEERLLPDTLDWVHQALSETDLKGEVVVIDNNSTDATASIAAEAGVRLVTEPHRQISRARNAGAAVAQGRYLIFLDADTRLPAELLREALARLEADRVVGGGATLQLGDTHPDDQPGLGGWASRVWNWISVKRRLACGCFFFTRKDAFDETGGFSEKVYAGEEIWFSRRLARWGRRNGKRRFEIIPSPPIISSDRKFEWYSPASLLIRAVLILVFPFITRWRWACGLWYAR